MRYTPFLLCCLLAACSPTGTGGPPRVRFGEDVCVRCGMIVSEQRFAAGYVDSKGKNIVYDDVGEALDAVNQSPELKSRLYVNDLEDPGWFPAAEAYFVHAPRLATPMGSGIAVFRTQARAASFSKSHGVQGPVDLTAALDFATTP